MYWKSESNTAYRVEFRPDLEGSNSTWDVLYDDFPSQGTNTFWLDAGDYSRTPEVLHPRQTTNRFYRLVKLATNSLPAPTVVILTPATNSTLSDEVSVSVAVTSTNSLYSLRLFLDGEDLGPCEDDGTNWVINTTEWPNGQHVLFAAAKVVDHYPGIPGDNSPAYAWGVSAYLPVSFDNLIHRVGFSEPFFEPALGQTQHVSAAFAANVDWTLQIIDESSNAVRTVTGSGTSLHFGWDGTDDGSSPIPDGVYFYVITAQTNGQALFSMSSGGGSFSSSSVSSLLDSETMETWAVQEKGSGAIVPLQLYPPGFDTNGLTIFEATQSEVFALNEALLALDESSTTTESFVEAMEGGSGSSGSSYAGAAQSTFAPKRQPTNPVKGVTGTFGVVAFGYASLQTNQVPQDPFGPIQLEGSTASVVPGRIPDSEKLAGAFGKVIKKVAYKQAFNKSGKDVQTIDLRRSDLGIGGGNLFNPVNLGMIVAHGNYGTSLDSSASTGGGSLQTYLAVDGTNNAADPWIRLSDFWFDGDLRWMGIIACSSLRDANYNSMLNKNALPISENFHLLCGATTVMYFAEYLGEAWAKELKAKQPVDTAWFNSGINTYQRAKAGAITGTVIFRVSGWTSCFSDRINAWTAPNPPTDTIDERTQQVYP